MVRKVPDSLSSFGGERRVLLQGAAAVAATAGFISRAHAATPEILAETASGRVRGAALGGVHVFKGIPYGASTAGPNRFLPPQPVTPWSGVRDALAYSNSAPQAGGGTGGDRAGLADITPVSEDCLYLNVYTPSATRTTRRPVMVWMHGGAWSVGAGSAPAINGETLARLGDVVVVTLNHRLNIFGYIKLDDSDERFADSANVGIQDMVAALRWVRDNAEAFGGDPRNVTIFGQSGGGAKVSALMVAPAARGLFHKVIAQSCSGSIRVNSVEAATMTSRNLATQLGLERLTGAAAQAIPMERLIQSGGGGRPFLDGRILSRHPFDPGAPPNSTGIPFMAGNAATETRIHMSAGADRQANFLLDATEVQRRVARYLRVDAPESKRIFDAYAASDATYTPGDILGAISTDYNYIRNTRLEATMMATAGAPTYSYIFNRRTPVLGGLLRTPHESEVPFVFGNPLAAWMTGGDAPDIEPTMRVMIATWSAFARTGDPNNPLVPRWPRHDPVERSSMMLSAQSRVERDPGGQARATLDQVPVFEYSTPNNYTRP